MSKKTKEVIEEKLSEPNPKISSKQFIKILKEDLGNSEISKSVFIAFLAIVPMIDTEDNYRKIWKTSFKRS